MIEEIHHLLFAGVKWDGRKETIRLKPSDDPFKEMTLYFYAYIDVKRVPNNEESHKKKTIHLYKNEKGGAHGRYDCFHLF